MSKIQYFDYVNQYSTGNKTVFFGDVCWEDDGKGLWRNPVLRTGSVARLDSQAETGTWFFKNSGEWVPDWMDTAMDNLLVVALAEDKDRVGSAEEAPEETRDSGVSNRTLEDALVHAGDLKYRSGSEGRPLSQVESDIVRLADEVMRVRKLAAESWNGFGDSD